MANLCPAITDPNNSGTCITCKYYRRGQCTSPDMEILRQDNKGGYELTYPLMVLIERVRKICMLSTMEVLQFLEDKYRVKIARTSIFDYEKLGMLSKVEKVGHGDRKGVKTYWETKTPLKIRYMIRLKEMGLTIKEMAEFNDILYNLKDEIKQFATFVDDRDSRIVWSAGSGVDPVKLSKFNTFVLFMGALEAGIEDYNMQYRGGMPDIKISDDPKESSVTVIYLEDNLKNGYMVQFKKDKVKAARLDLGKKKSKENRKNSTADKKREKT